MASMDRLRGPSQSRTMGKCWIRDDIFGRHTGLCSKGELKVIRTLRCPHNMVILARKLQHSKNDINTAFCLWLSACLFCVCMKPVTV